MATLKTTGKKMRFRDVAMGQPFFAHGAYWVRTSFEAAAELCGSTWVGAACCNFTIEGNHPSGEEVYEVDVKLDQPSEKGFHKTA